MKRNLYALFCLLLFSGTTSFSQLIHPGVSHKSSDLERMKYQVNAGIEPWKSSFEKLQNDGSASYNYTVNGATVNGADGLVYNGDIQNYMQSDALAAYLNALMWYITEDERHAEKCVEIFNSWSSIRSVENVIPLDASRQLWRMLEAAEIIKHTYSGWSESEIEAFSDMLVYPGYSNTTKPTGDVGFYWVIYNGDRGRHGNQGLFAYRTVMAMAIFLDNEIMYDRGLNYLKGGDNPTNDLAYEPGPPNYMPLDEDGSNEYYLQYRPTGFSDEIENYGYNELISNYIFENGQCQESSRDQSHPVVGISNIAIMCEMAWNQGDDLYGFLDNRVLLGLEYHYRYNLSYTHSFPDQLTPWEPTVESGEFIEITDRSGRWRSLKINPFVGNNLERITRGTQNNSPVHQMILGHYRDRMNVEEEDRKWVTRANDIAFEERGVETVKSRVDYPVFGHLAFHRVDEAPGDPINGFSTDGLPKFSIPVLPATIEAENYDYFALNGNGKTYYDNGSGNNGNQYREDEDVDIEVCDEGGFNLGWVAPGEWLTYTVYVPETGTYDFSVRYAANGEGGALAFSVAGVDKTGDVAIPSTGDWQAWESLTLAEGVLLAQGVQSIRLNIKGSTSVVNVNHFTISKSESCALGPADVNQLSSLLEPGIKFDYYEGDWNVLPDFNSLTKLDSGITSLVELDNGEQDDYYGFVFNGYVKIETDGEYTFYTKSDDGTKLYIDGVLIVTNDGTHGAIEEQGSICLQPGFHEIKVEYFDKVGTNDVLQASYEGPGVSKQEIRDLFHLPSDIVVSTNKENSSSLIDVFPNPSTDIITLSYKGKGDSKLEIVNSSAQVVHEMQCTKSKAVVDVSSWPSGIYLIKLINENGDVKIKELVKK